MDRGCTIIFILLSISVYGLGFSSGDWFEISGCYLLGGTIIKNETSLPANEPGECLSWCGTKTVALQGTHYLNANDVNMFTSVKAGDSYRHGAEIEYPRDYCTHYPSDLQTFCSAPAIFEHELSSTCLCINDDQTLNRTFEHLCSQKCSGVEENFKCGGSSNDHISVYRERGEISAVWGSPNGSECLTYCPTANEIVSKFVPDKCTEKHPFYCYSATFGSKTCFRQTYINDLKTWYEALEYCRRPSSRLWPAQEADNCTYIITSAKFWVAVHQWTKVVPTSTISSTTTTPSSATPKTSTTLSTTTVTKSNTYTSTMTPSISTNSGNPSTTKAGTSTTSTTSLSATSTSSTTMAPNIAAILSTNSSSMTTSTSTSAKTTRSSGPPTSTNGNEPATSVTSGLTSNFQIDPPNLGLGIAIGSVVGFLISITIAYCWRRMCTRLFQRKRAFDNATYEIERL